MKDNVKKISGKKIALLIVVSLLAALILAVGIFFGVASCNSSRRLAPVLKEGFTVRKTAPTDGSIPTDHSGLDNIAYMAYVLDNQPYYHAFANNSTKSSGVEQITKTWKDYKSAAVNGTDNSVMVCSDLSYSSFVKSSAQTCFVGDKDAYMRTGNKPGKNSTPSEINWNSGSPTHYTTETYLKKYGEFSTELTVYVLNEDTVASWSDVKDNGDGTYSQTFRLNEDAAVWYRNKMKTNGSLKNLPEFEKIEITFTFDSKWQILESYCEEKATITPSALGGAPLPSNSKTTTTFDYSEAGFDNAHFANFKGYYENYVGKEPTGSTGTDTEVTMLDVLGSAFSQVVNPEDDGQQFDLNLTIGQTDYTGKIYAKLGDMGDILGSLDVRLALEKKDSGKQDLFVEFSGGAVNVYYSDSFALIADIDKIADSVSRIKELINGSEKIEVQDIAYALSEDGEGTSLNLDSLLAALSFTNDETANSANISILTDDLLGLGIGVDLKLDFKGNKDDGFTFISGGLGSLSYKGTPVNLSLALAPDVNSAKISHNKAEASANLADYLNGVYGLLNSKTYLVDLSLDGTSKIEYISGLKLSATAQVKQENGFNEISVSVPVSVEYGTLSVELDAFYTVNLDNKNYGTVYLNLKEISGKTPEAKVYCDISETVKAVKNLINRFKVNKISLLSEDGETAEEVNTVANVINMVLGLDYGKIITELKADGTEIGVTVNVDEILGALNKDLGVKFGSLALTLVNGEEKASLGATLSELGLTLGVSGSDTDITDLTDLDEKEYANLTAYVNGVNGLLESESIVVGINLDGTSEIEYINGVVLEAKAQLKLENGYNLISVNVPLTVSYNGLSVELEVYYTVNLDTKNTVNPETKNTENPETKNYGEVYLNIKSINEQPYGLKVYCNISDTVDAVNKLKDLINSTAKVAPLSEDGEANEANEADGKTDKIANIINAVINIDYASIINEITANSDEIKISVNADEILDALKLELKEIELGNLTLELGLDNSKNATFNGRLSALGLDVAINGSEAKLPVPEKTEYLDAIEFIDIVSEAVRQAQAIITAQDIEFSINATLTVDGIAMSVVGTGEAVWNEKGILRFAADLTLTIAEKENSESVKVKFVYDGTEGEGPLVRFTVNELGLEIYQSNIDEIGNLIEEVKNAVSGITGNTSAAALSLDEETGGNGGEQAAIDYVKILGTVLDLVSNVTLGLSESEITDASVRDILIKYTDKASLLLGANGGLSLKLDTEVIKLTASVKAGNCDKIDEINSAMSATNDDGENIYTFYNADKFTKAVYNYVLDLLDNLTVKKILGSNTFTVEVVLNGTDSGIKELDGINVTANLYYTEIDSKLIEADITLDIKGTQVIAKAYYTERTIYIALENVGGTALTDIAFKASTSNIYDAAATLVEIITSDTFAEIVKLLNKEDEVDDGEGDGEGDGEEEIVTLSEESKASLTDILTNILTLDFDELISREKIDGKNTLTVKPDRILEAFGVDIRVGDVRVEVNPETHSLYASVKKNESKWLTFNAEAVANIEHATFNPDKFIDIDFVSTLLEDINTTLKNAGIYGENEEGEPKLIENRAIFSFEGEISIDIVIAGEIKFNDAKLTAGLDEAGGFYVSFEADLIDKSILGMKATTAGRVVFTYSNGYITMGRIETDGTENYKVMTRDYLIDNLLDASKSGSLFNPVYSSKSPIPWWLGMGYNLWYNVIERILPIFAKDLNLSAGLTKPQEYYMYEQAEETPPENTDTDNSFALSTYLNSLIVNGNNLVGEDDKFLGNLNIGEGQQYYAFDINPAFIGTLTTISAAILRNDTDGIQGLTAYAAIDNNVKVTVNLGNTTTEHAPNYFKIITEEHNDIKFDYEDRTEQYSDIFGCYTTNGKVYDYSRILSKYTLSIVDLDGNVKEVTLRYSSTVYVSNGETVWIDDSHKLIYTYDEAGENEVEESFVITDNVTVYEQAVYVDKVTFTLISAVDFTLNGIEMQANENEYAVTMVGDYLLGNAVPYTSDYLFLGWAKQTGENLEFTTAVSEEGATYYAIWGAAREEIVSLNAVTSGSNPDTVSAKFTNNASGCAWYADSAYETKVNAITTENTILYAKLQYSFDIELSAENTDWYYTVSDNENYIDLTYKSSWGKWTITNGTKVEGTVLGIKIEEGNSINVYRYWKNALVLQVVDGSGEVVNTYLIKGFNTKNSNSYRDLAQDASHYVEFNDGEWIISDSLKNVEGTNMYYLSGSNDNGLLLANIENMSGGAKFTCKA